MITIYKTNEARVKKGKYFTTEEKGIEIRGLSTDDKPTTINDEDVPNGSTFIEMNTGKLYMYDLTNTTWREL